MGQKKASKPGRTSPKALKTSHEEDNDKEWYLFELLAYALLYWWLTLDQLMKCRQDFIFHIYDSISKGLSMSFYPDFILILP